MSKRKIGIVVVVLLLLVAGTIWAFKARADAKMARLKQMQDKMFAAGMPQREQVDQFRKEVDQLSDDQRGQVFEHMGEIMQRRIQKQADDYFALPPEKRNDFLDKQIQEMEKRRKEWAARRAQDGQGGPGQGGVGQNPSTPGQGSNTANAGRQWGGGRNASPGVVSSRRNQMLDSSSPAQRAQRSVYFSALQQRRIELGLPAWSGGGPFSR
jgi:hypothetical protein